MSRSPLSMIGNGDGAMKYSKTSTMNGAKNHSGDMGYAEMMEASSMEAPYGSKSSVSYSSAEKAGPHVHSKHVSQNVSHDHGHHHEEHRVSEEYKNHHDDDYHDNHHEGNGKQKGGMGGSVCALFVWFLIIFILAWLVLFALKPQFVLKPDSEELDTGKTLLAAAVIALVIIIIIWLIKGCTSRSW